MQCVIFLTTFLERGASGLNPRVPFPDVCIQRFYKTIVKLNKKVHTFFHHSENQHFLSRDVGFFLLANLNHNNKNATRRGSLSKTFGENDFGIIWHAAVNANKTLVFK